MKLVALSLALAVAVGYLLGGRLSRLSELQLRYGPLALVGLLLQLLDPPGPWPLVLLLASFVLLGVFVAANIRVAGFALILIGVVMNFSVIVINGGMPVGRHALVASGQADTLLPLLQEGGAKHHVASSEDRLVFLADVIPIPTPVNQAISVGDLFTFGGVGVVVAAAMRRRRGTPSTSAIPEAGHVAV